MMIPPTEPRDPSAGILFHAPCDPGTSPEYRLGLSVPTDPGPSAPSHIPLSGRLSVLWDHLTKSPEAS